MLTTSEENDEVCECVVKTGLHSDMLTTLGLESLSEATMKDQQSQRSLVMLLISILHNVVRRTESARDAFRQSQAVDVMQKFRDFKSYPVNAVFLFVTQGNGLTLISGVMQPSGDPRHFLRSGPPLTFSVLAVSPTSGFKEND